MSERHFPILRHPEYRLPWALLVPHERQALKNHFGQTLEHLARRGGLGFAEAAAILEDREYRDIQFPGEEPSEAAARDYLDRLVTRLS